MRIKTTLLAIALGLAFTGARADITIGVTLSATGPAASLGIPEKNTIALLPTTIGGQKVNYIVLDDASDPTTASKNARKLVAENKVDALIGSTTTPTSMAVLEVAAEAQTPVLTMAPTPFPADKMAWGFQMPQNVSLMASAIVDNMKTNGVKSVAFIGYADAYGEVWLKGMTPLLDAAGIKLVATERYQRADTSVTGQALKIVAARPDAVLVAGSGTPSVLPQATLAERGYKGRMYQTHGSANNDFLRVGGKNVEAAILPVGPLLVAEQLADSHPVKKSALDFVKAYEGANGAGSRSTFGAHAWDAGVLLQNAIPMALKKAQPGSADFRKALRDALEATKEVAGAIGVFTMSAKDHAGLDQRSRVLVAVDKGAWKLLK